MANKPIRIANFSGYYGDRYTAIAEALHGDPVDVLAGDYLAEITMAGLSAKHQLDSSRGYVEYFVDQLRPHLPTIAQRGIKIVTNAGGFHPAGLAAVLRDEIATSGLNLRVAHVEGDNILSQLPELERNGYQLDNLDSGAPLCSWRTTPFATNAYLGGWGIAKALAEGVDIVVCGRVTDASLILGPAAWWHGWARDDWNTLAGGVVAGHIIECGPQAVGGNFSGFALIPNMVTPGFPIAEISEDGSSVITKHQHDGGAVTVDTVTAQLVYEIQGPRYLNPDVTVHLDHVRVSSLGPDRVLVTGAEGSPPPPTTKVAIFGPIGYAVVNTIYVTAPDVAEKIELLRAQLHENLPENVSLDLTPIGVAADDPETQWEATVSLRVMASAAEAEPLERFNMARRLAGLYLQSIPGYFHDGAAVMQSTPQVRVDYWPGLLPMTAVDHRVVFDDGHVLSVAPPRQTQSITQPVHPEPEEAPLPERVRKVPLGTVAYARSGDKGGNSNVGIWTPDVRTWPWLRRFLSSAELRRLIPEAKDLVILRHELPELRAVHFVLRGMLGTGGSSNVRVDRVGKAIGEYMRSKQVPIPDDLLTRSAVDVIDDVSVRDD
jgi:Acyclic terpene utilisation family protein AtuA